MTLHYYSAVVSDHAAPPKEFIGALGLLKNPRIASFGTSRTLYGRAHEFSVDGKRFELVPLVHPRQSAGLWFHVPALARAHEPWVEAKLARLS